MGCGPSNSGSAQQSNQTQNHVITVTDHHQKEEELKEEERRKAEETRRLEEERQQQLEQEERQRKLKEEEERQRKLKEEEEKLKAQEEEEKRRREEVEEERRKEEELRRKEEEQEQKKETQSSGAEIVAVASAGLDFGYIEAAVDEHNQYRALHGMPPITHSVALSNYAQKWAVELSTGDGFAHSNCTLDNGTRVGENLAMGFQSTGAELPAKNAVKMWYDEIKDYEKYFGGEPDMKEFMKYGHFTQVVWKETKEVGIGKILKDGKTIVVGTYLPPGNMMGTFKDNVFPPV